jgi:hypothetical protein
MRLADDIRPGSEPNPPICRFLELAYRNSGPCYVLADQDLSFRNREMF